MPLDTTNIQFPAKMECLFQPKMYKIFYGGRGGAKTWNFARALLLMGATRPLRVLCCRELQNSIDESVKKVLEEQVKYLGLEEFYPSNLNIKTSLKGINGTEFFFEGLKHNTGKIRSYEGIDICWVEEAANVSDESWQELIPTIRKDGSEIWVAFNPRLETDATYVRFVKNKLPEDMAFTVEVNWRDNPWFTARLKREMEALRDSNYDEYLHVYEGKCKQVLAGAVYAKEIRAAQDPNAPRIRSVPYDTVVPVDAIFDLGRADATAIWFRQRVGFEWRFIKYYENNQQHIGFYLDYLRTCGYRINTVWLPHDSKAKLLGSKLTVYEQVRDGGFNVRVVKKLTIEDGINAARTVFPMCWFDEANCADGLMCLRMYRYEVVNEQTGELSRAPVHDIYSHGADAFRYAAVSIGQLTRGQPQNLVGHNGGPRLDDDDSVEGDWLDYSGKGLRHALPGQGSGMNWMKR
jgi:phage terminase large subunit